MARVTMRRTASVWGPPPPRLYRFIHVVENAFPRRRLIFAVLGCSDGRFVLPLARRGHSVVALDVDTVALFGGAKKGPSGKVAVIGLTERLRRERLRHLVTIQHADYTTVTPTASHGVFTSGSIHYSRNLAVPVAKLMERIKPFVRPHGYLYIDYMLPVEARHASRQNYLRRGELRKYFQASDWRILMDQVRPRFIERAHVDNPVDHYHQLGYFLAQRL